jgi:hypothetical protein
VLQHDDFRLLLLRLLLLLLLLSLLLSCRRRDRLQRRRRWGLCPCRHRCRPRPLAARTPDLRGWLYCLRNEGRQLPAVSAALRREGGARRSAYLDLKSGVTCGGGAGGEQDQP